VTATADGRDNPAVTATADGRSDPAGAELAEVILENLADGIVVLSSEGRIEHATAGLERMLGAPAGALDGLDCAELLHPADRDAALADIEHSIARGNQSPGPVSFRLAHHDGSWVTTEIEAAPGLLDGGRMIVTVRDVSKWVAAELKLEQAKSLRELVGAIAARFVDVTPDAVDDLVDAALADLGRFTGVDRSYVFRYAPDLLTMDNTHEWCAPGIEPAISKLQGLPSEKIPAFHASIGRGASVKIPRVAELPAMWARERVIFEDQDIQALVAVPMTRAGTLVGFLGCDSVRRERIWDEDFVGLLRVAADVIGSALARRDAQLDAALREKRLRALVANSGDLIVVLDRTGSFVMPPLGRNILSLAGDDLPGKSALDLIHPDDLEKAIEALGFLVERPGTRGTLELRLVNATGEHVPVEVVGVNALENPVIDAIVLNVRDVRDRVRTERELRDSEERLRTLVMSIPGAVFQCEVEPPYRDVFVSDAIYDLTGFAAEEFLSHQVLFEQLILPKHRARTDRELEAAIRTRRPYEIEYPIRHRSGQVRWLAEQGQISFDAEGTPRFLEGVILDVSARKTLEEQLAHDAAHDPLTDLPNRVRLLEHLNEQLAEASRRPYTVAVLFLDLDRFKLVNDALGHRAGDELLVAFARRLSGVLRAGDLATRSGGDEFVVVCSDIRSPVEAEHVAERIRRMLRLPFDLHGREVFVTASTGIAIADGCANATDLLRDADAAAYRAKERGRNRYEVFDTALRAATAAALETETALHRAVKEDQLILHYQPVIAFASGRVVGFEGLLRWQHPERGLLTPDAFIDAAEASGLIVPIGHQVINLACQTLAGLRDDQLGLAVNLSPRELAQPDLVDRVRAAMRDWGIDPSRLCLEITEGALFEDAGAALDTLDALKDAGVRLAIDDFGTGYSSLSYLSRMPVDVVKIDRSFVAELKSDGSGDTIVAGVASLARGLGLDVVAEGIEHRDQADLVRRLLCTHGQGYVWSRPVPLDEAVSFASRTPLLGRALDAIARH